MARDLPEAFFLQRLEAFLTPAIATAKKSFGRARSSVKKDNSLVTEADLAISKIWYKHLADLKNDPLHCFVDEETVEAQKDLWQRIDRSRYLWVLDPIDGTSSYACGRPMWGICAAVLKDKKPYIGMTYLANDDGIITVSPQKFTFQKIGGRAQKIPPLRPLPQATLALDSGLAKVLDFARLPYKFNYLGASCTMIGWTALGRYTAVSSLGALWDIASLWPAMKRQRLDHFRLSDGAPVNEVSPEFFDSKLKIKDFCVFSTKAECDRIRGFITKK